MKRLILTIIFLCATLMSMAQYGRNSFNSYPVSVSGVVSALESIGDTLILGGNFEYAGTPTGPLVILDPTTRRRISNNLFARMDLVSVNEVITDGSGGWFLFGDFRYINDSWINGMIHLNRDMSLDTQWPYFRILDPDAVAIANGFMYVSYSHNHAQNGLIHGIYCIDIAKKTIVTTHNLTINGSVNAMAVRGDSLFMAGEFTQVGGQQRNKIALVHANTQSLMAWNPNPVLGTINEMIIEENDLYIGGVFTSAGIVPAVNLAKLNAITGSVVQGFQVNQVNYLFKSDTVLYCLRDSNATLERVNISTGTKKDMSSIFNSSQIHAAAIVKDKLFYAYVESGTPLGLMLSYDLKREAPETDTTIFSGRISSICTTDSAIVVLGRFESMGGYRRNRISAINTRTNELLDFNAGSSDLGTVTALKHHNGKLYIGSSNSGVIVVLNASSGAELTQIPSINGAVSDLTVSGNTLYVAGTFTLVQGQNRHGFAAFDISSGALLPWSPGRLSPASALGLKVVSRSNGILLVGTFDSLGGIPRSGVALVDASVGQPTAFAVNLEGRVTHLEINGNTAYVAGRIISIDGQPRANLAAFDLTTGLAKPWYPLDTFEVQSMHIHNNMVVVAGWIMVSGFTSTSGAKVQGYDMVTAAELPFRRNFFDGVLKFKSVRDRIYASGMIIDILDDLRVVGLVSLSDCVGFGESVLGGGGYFQGCAGDPYILGANPQDSVIWSTGETTHNITINRPGVYIATPIRNGCVGTSAIYTYVTQSPPATPVLTTSGPDNNILTATPGSTSYAWYDGTMLMAKTFINTYKAQRSGNYSVVAYNNSCASSSSAVVTALGDPKNTDALQLYPNPANSTLNLHLLEGTLHQVTLLDFLGRQVHIQKVEGASTTLDIAHLPAGAYLCRITTATGTLVRKLSVEH